MKPLTPFIDYNAGRARGIGFVINTEHHTDKQTDKSKYSTNEDFYAIEPGKSAEIIVSLINNQNFPLGVNPTGTGDLDKVSAVFDDIGRKTITVTIDPPARNEEFEITLHLYHAENEREMIPYTLPKMKALYLDDSLEYIQAGPRNYSNALILGYTVSSTPASLNTNIEIDPSDEDIVQDIQITAILPLGRYSSFKMNNNNSLVRSSDTSHSDYDVSLARTAVFDFADITIPITVTADSGKTETYKVNVSKEGEINIQVDFADSSKTNRPFGNYARAMTEANSDTTATLANPVKVTILKDLTVGSTTITGNIQLLSDGNKTLTLQDGDTSMFTVNSGASLTLGDTNTSDSITLNGNDHINFSIRRGVTVNTGGTLIMNNTAVIRCFRMNTNPASVGAGVSVSGGTFRMNGGSIQENRADNGAGVYVAANSTFEMSGGVIYGNDSNTSSLLKNTLNTSAGEGASLARANNTNAIAQFVIDGSKIDIIPRIEKEDPSVTYTNKTIRMPEPYDWYNSPESDGIYRISNAAELQEFRNIVNGTASGIARSSFGSVGATPAKIVMLTNDIDISHITDWVPIGGSTTPFSGIFEGNGKIITGLTVTRDDTISDNGLFGNIADATIKNLGLIDANVSGGQYSGSIVGQAWRSVISNCFNSGNGSVTGAVSTGGIAGEIIGAGAKIENCYSTVPVTGTTHVGGIVGNNHREVTTCYSTSAVEGTDYVGGITGYNWNDASVTQCVALNLSVISGTNNAGRVTGFITNPPLTSNNRARNDLYVNFVVTAANATATEKDGENMTVGTGTAGTQFSTVFTGFTSPQWSTITGTTRLSPEVALPILTGFTSTSTPPLTQNPKLPMFYVAEIGTGSTSTKYTNLQDAIDATTGQTIRIINNIYAQGSFNVIAGKTITIVADTEDRTITLIQRLGVSLFNVNGTLNLGNGTNTKKIILSGGTGIYAAESGRRGINVNGGTLNMYNDAVIRNFRSSSSGAGVSLTGGSFVMYGGSIEGNVSQSYGGGVYVGGSAVVFGSFTMNGGTIYGSTDSATASLNNSASSGGASLYVVVGVTTANYGGDYGSGAILPGATSTVRSTNATLPEYAVEVDTTPPTRYMTLQAAIDDVPSNGTATITVLRNISANNISITDRTITIIADNNDRSITKNNTARNLFVIGNQGTLKLGGGGATTGTLTLYGQNDLSHSMPLIEVDSATAVLELYNKAEIRNNFVGSAAVGAGVRVWSNGGTFNMYGGVIAGCRTNSGNGGGVYVQTNSVFRKTGGTIYGNEVTPNTEDRNIVGTGGGISYGHAVFWNSAPNRYRNTTLYENDDISTTDPATNWNQ